jgi:predicted nucleic acid-binding protein
MVTTSNRLVVADAGPVLHLDELACLDLLDDFAPVYLAQTVADEVARHRPGISLVLPRFTIVPDPSVSGSELVTLASGLSLHASEMAALALAQDVGASLLLCDDTAARLAAESLGLRVHGTIGVLVRAIRRRQRSADAVLELLGDLPGRCTLHASRALIAEVIARITKEQRIS